MAKFTKGRSGNPNGRPPGSSNTIPSSKEIKDSFKKLNKAAVLRLAQALTGEDNNLAFKAAVKIADINYSIALDDEKQARISKRKLEIKTPQDAAGEDEQGDYEVTVEQTSPKTRVLRLATKNK